jgi:hypothetical protein
MRMAFRYEPFETGPLAIRIHSTDAPDVTINNIMTSNSPMHLSERVPHRIDACMTGYQR